MAAMPPSSVPPSLGPDSRARWGQERRLAFIDFRLQFEGRINRSDLSTFFGISSPQASQDLARYQSMAPNNLRYDASSKTYLAGETFVPQYGETDAASFLNDVLALHAGIIARDSSFIGYLPAFGIVPTPHRPVPAAALVLLLAAMRDQRSVEILYQSMGREHPTQRAVAPHALAHDGFRWHIRAYCHQRQEFRDFVLGRILEFARSDVPWMAPEADTKWHTLVTLELAPNPGLSTGQRRAIALDYGMEEERLSVQCRQSLLFYALRRLGLDQSGEPNPSNQHIVLTNREMVLPFLQKTGSADA